MLLVLKEGDAPNLTELRWVTPLKMAICRLQATVAEFKRA